MWIWSMNVQIWTGTNDMFFYRFIHLRQLSLREFHFEVLRDPLTQIYYFRAIEVGSVDRDGKRKICHSNKAPDHEIFSVRRTPNHKNGVRYERSMSEPEVNSLLLPNERWKMWENNAFILWVWRLFVPVTLTYFYCLIPVIYSSMVSAATALLKRAILIATSNGSDTSKTHRLCDQLLLTFDGQVPIKKLLSCHSWESIRWSCDFF